MKDMSVLRILFVCMGNICRSPAAEVICHEMLDQAGLEGKVEIDSAGTTGYHEGAPPDKRMGMALRRRGYHVFGQARKIEAADLAKFDLIVAMDEENLREVKALDVGREYWGKIKMFSDFFRKHKDNEVPDPYYGGVAGFEYVIDLLEDGCQNLIKDIMPKMGMA